MIPRNMRLSRAHFAPSGPETRAATRHFSLSVRPAAGTGGCAAVVSKKVARLSVTRHRLKRRILATLRPWCDPSVAIVIYARPGSPLLTFDDLSAEIESLLVRVFGKVR